MNPWDQFADLFGCRWDEAEIPACAADNIGIAMPFATRHPEFLIQAFQKSP